MALAVALCSTNPARAQLTFSGEAHVGSGYDSNIYLDAAALPEDVAGHGGPFLELAARVGLGADLNGHQLWFIHDAQFRQLLLGDDEDSRRQERVLLFHAPPALWGVQLELGGGVEVLDYASSHGGGWLGALGLARLGRDLGRRWRVSLGYIINATWYNSASSAGSETTHRVRAVARFRPIEGLELEADYRLALGRTDPAPMSSLSNGVGLLARWRPANPPLRVQAGYRLEVFDLPDGARMDLIHEAHTSVDWRLLRWLHLGVDVRLLWGSSDLDQVPDYARHQVLARATFRWRVHKAGRRKEPPVLALPPGALRAEPEVHVDHMSDGAEVAVVGTFNGWDPDKDPMERHRESWTAVLSPPPGLHRYMVSVDGRIEEPQSCDRWIRDGFGGRSCVVMVPPATAGEVELDPGPRHRVLLGAEALAELPLQMGGRVWAELPGRIRVGTTVGAMPGFYLSAINTALTSGGAMRTDEGKLIGAAVEQVLIWRLSLGWRPFSGRGFYFSAAYLLGLLEGFLPVHLLEVAAKAAPVEVPGLDRYKDGAAAETSLHMIHLELGWTWSAPPGLSLRLALGAALTASASTRVDATGTAADYPQVARLAGKAEINISDMLETHAFTPTISLAVGWQMGL